MGGRGHFALVGQPGQKRLDIGLPERGGMLHPMKPDVITHPMDIGVFSSYAAIEVADALPECIQNPGRLERGKWGESRLPYSLHLGS